MDTINPQRLGNSDLYVKFPTETVDEHITRIYAFGTELMYLIEGPEYGFTTLNASVYWAIVTITTVGYGDITPHTPLGRILASILILIGYSIIAIPTGLITTHMTSALNRRRQQRLCPQCQQGDHDDNARFCHACGHALPK